MAELDDQDKKIENFKKILECPICLETSVPPIYTCIKGHLICQECNRKVTKCPICSASYTGTRNFAVEELYDKLHLADKPEDNFLAKNGPQAEADLAITKENLKISGEFRPVICRFRAEGCNNSEVNFFSYIKHLRYAHKVPVFPGPHIARIDDFLHVEGYAGNNRDQRNPRSYYGRHEMFIMNCFDRNFTINFHEERERVCIWAALHGSEEETDEYGVKFSIKDSPLTEILNWERKVFGIREAVEQIAASSTIFMRVLPRFGTRRRKAGLGEMWRNCERLVFTLDQDVQPFLMSWDAWRGPESRPVLVVKADYTISIEIFRNSSENTLKSDTLDPRAQLVVPSFRSNPQWSLSPPQPPLRPPQTEVQDRLQNSSDSDISSNSWTSVESSTRSDSVTDSDMEPKPESTSGSNNKNKRKFWCIIS